ncbi:MAG: fibronectin type III domain-containing protein [Bacteroidota bacterium]|nr:fibronectin type III domain-containing protein [Bacteroidota bacterium]
MVKYLLGFILIFTQFKSFSQSLSNYGVSRTTGITYSSISSSANPINYWRNTTINQNDDNRSLAIPIGFDFWYNGKRYTSLSVCSNGYIDFSSTIYDGNDSPGFPSGSGYVACGGNYSYRENPINMYSFGCGATAPNFYDGTYLALAPFYTDIWVGNAGANAIANSIKYNLTGTAPNRVFTVEYINMDDWASAAVSDYNFQVKIYESSGRIEFVYGTMFASTGAAPAYACGLNDILTSSPGTAAQLKLQQTANSTTFNNTQTANLTTVPSSNSRLTFSPPCPSSPTGALTLSSITNNSMTLNFPNWATNEVGYVIYYSTDNITFNYLNQTAANATSFGATGLIPSTTYYWRVVAVTEGCLSSALSASATTSSGSGKISNQSGNWSNSAIWTPAGVPTAGDNVTIANGHTVTINTNGVCNSLIIGQGTAARLQYNGGTARSLTLGSQLTVNTNGSFIVNTGSAASHSLIIKNNIVNNGTLNFNNSATSNCTTFLSNNIGNISFSGSGATNSFGNINLNLTNSTDVLTISSSNFSAISNFLTLTKGILNLSTVNTVNITPFTAATTISFYTGLVLNSANLTVNTTNNLNLIGNLTITNGTLNVGNAADEDLQVSGGNISLSNGAINVAGKFYSTGINDIFNLSVSGGTITVPTVGSTNTTIAPFKLTGTGSVFNMSNGSIIIPKSGGTTQNLGYNVSGSINGGVTGGTLQVGSPLTTANQTMQIISTFSLGNLLINSNRATGSVTTSSLNIIKDVAINSGTLVANALNIQLAGNWTNAGLFSAGTGSVIFSSNSTQSFSHTGGETFNHIVFSGSGQKNFGSNITANGNFLINSGAPVNVSTSNFQLTARGNFINNGSFNAQNGLVFLNGSTSQSIGGTSITSFSNITLGNSAGAVLTNSVNLLGTLTLTNGAFASSGFLTMVSNSSGTARIAQITGSGDITGNVTVQRFAPGGTTGWTLLGTPISSALTFADWNDNIPITCPICPNGTAGGFTSIYSYSEAATGSYSSASSYVPINNITNVITPLKGYWVYFGSGTYTTPDITVDVTGNVNKNNVAINLTRTNTGSPSDDEGI